MAWSDWLAAICSLHHSEAPMSLLSSSDTRDELADLAGEAVATQIRHGLTEEQAIDLIADVLDALIVLPEPLDTGSDIAIKLSLKAIAEALRRDPAKMELRALELMRDAALPGTTRKERSRKLRRAARLRKRAQDLIDRRGGV